MSGCPGGMTSGVPRRSGARVNKARRASDRHTRAPATKRAAYAGHREAAGQRSAEGTGRCGHYAFMHRLGRAHWS